MVEKSRYFTSGALAMAAKAAANNPSLIKLREMLIKSSGVKNINTLKFYAGFVDGKLHIQEINDGFGGDNKRMSPMLFKTRKEAKKQYQDVRPITIIYELQ